MSSERMRNVWKYVLPTMLSSICMFLFTIVDGIFVGRGVGTDALGAVNIAFPIVMVLNALYTLATLGGLTVCLQGFCRNDGSPVLCSIAVTSTAVCNIFLDWLFIFPLKMGTAGAAIATGISQTISLFIVLAHFMGKKGQLRLRFTKIDFSLFKKIILRGSPESIAQFAMPVLTVCLNLMLAHYIGDIGINAFSVMAYVSTFAIAIFFGTSEGLQPLFGQSYGEKNESDLRFYYYVGFDTNVFGSALVTILVVIFARPICALFGTDGNTLDYVVETMPKFSWAFIPMSFNVMVSAYFYSTKRTNYAIVINLLRSLCTNALAILILPLIFGEKIIWFTFGISEAIVACVSLWFVIHARRKGIEFK